MEIISKLPINTDITSNNFLNNLTGSLLDSTTGIPTKIISSNLV